MQDQDEYTTSVRILLVIKVPHPTTSRHLLHQSAHDLIFIMLSLSRPSHHPSPKNHTTLHCLNLVLVLEDTGLGFTATQCLKPHHGYLSRHPILVPEEYDIPSIHSLFTITHISSTFLPLPPHHWSPYLLFIPYATFHPHFNCHKPTFSLSDIIITVGVLQPAVTCDSLEENR